MTSQNDRLTERQVLRLVDALIDGSIRDEDFQRLSKAVGEHPEVLETYVDYLNIHSALRQRFHSHATAEGDRLDIPVGDDAARLRPKQFSAAIRKQWKFYLAAIAATLATAWAAALYQSSPNRDGRSILPQDFAQRDSAISSAVEPVESVAVLTRLVDVEWEDGVKAKSLGAPLPRQRLKIKSGLALVEFYCGAAVIIEGPAAFDLVAPDRGFAHYGKLRAHVPARARGFTIGTESGDVVDLGTEFGLDISTTGQSEVHVLDGEVDFHDAEKTDGAPHRLVGGQAIELALDGAPHRLISSDASRFVGHKQLNARANEQHRDRYQQWLDYHTQLRMDPTLVADYVFDNTEGWGRTLVNAATSADESSYGAIVGASWQRGRWPQSKALSFDSPSDRVRIKLDGEFDSLTLATWVNVAELAGKRSVALLHPEIDLSRSEVDERQRFIHWTMNPTPSGAVLHFAESHGFRTLDRNHYGSVAHGVSNQDLGSWIHLALVYDSNALEVSHYCNGELIKSVPIESPRILAIGVADLCNWPYKEWAANTQFEFRNMNGLMDEFVVLGRALSIDEIREMHVIGQP
ncbi:MAG: LamG-like jellyroll fold domain-containing protein [Planctomycetota bacterium]